MHPRRRLMKLVTAVIKPHMVEAVTEALHAIDVQGITITDVRGHGRQRGHSEVYRGGEYTVDYLPKAEIKVLTKDGEAEKVANVIMEAARTGKIGDGKLWISAVETTIRIRTGDVGDEAI
jgi:nitrogen regulatory protein P-II 1